MSVICSKIIISINKQIFQPPFLSFYFCVCSVSFPALTLSPATISLLQESTSISAMSLDFSMATTTPCTSTPQTWIGNGTQRRHLVSTCRRHNQEGGTRPEELAEFTLSSLISFYNSPCLVSPFLHNRKGVFCKKSSLYEIVAAFFNNLSVFAFSNLGRIQILFH